MGNLGYGAYPTHPGEVLKDEIEESALITPEYTDFSQEEDVPVKVSMEEANKFLKF